MASTSGLKPDTASAKGAQSMPQLPPQYTPSAIPQADFEKLSSNEVSAQPQYLYYRLFHQNVPISPRQKFDLLDGDKSEADSARGLIGRVRSDHISPPRMMSNLKGYITEIEGFVSGDIRDIYLPNGELATDIARLQFSVGAPGTDVNAPLEVVIQDEASRSDLPQLFDPSMWSIGADGLAEPNVDQNTPCRLASVANPPRPWKRAHVKGVGKKAWIRLHSTGTTYNLFPLQDFGLIYVNDSEKRILTRLQPHDSLPRLFHNKKEPAVLGEHYRVIVVAEKLVALMHVDDIEFERP